MEYNLEKYENNRYLSISRKAELLTTLFMKKRAIKILENHISQYQYQFEIPKGSLLVRLGLLYASQKDYVKASLLIDQALEVVQGKQYPYSSELKLMLSTFEKANRLDLYNKWKNDFEKRIVYDKQFKKLLK